MTGAHLPARGVYVGDAHTQPAALSPLLGENDVDLDSLTRDQLPEVDEVASIVTAVHDEWLFRAFGLSSGGHHVGLFLDLLAAEGYRVTKTEAPELSDLLGPPVD